MISDHFLDILNGNRNYVNWCEHHERQLWAEQNWPLLKKNEVDLAVKFVRPEGGENTKGFQ